MTKKKWLDNAFWHDLQKKDAIEAILEIVDEDGRVITQQLSVKKYGPNKKINPDFKDLVSSVGRAKITKNTNDRIARKKKERELADEQRKSKEQQKELEKLFDAKLKILEIDEIKNTKNRKLKSKLRRSKNTIEMNMYATLILMEENGIGIDVKDEK